MVHLVQGFVEFVDPFLRYLKIRFQFYYKKPSLIFRLLVFFSLISVAISSLDSSGETVCLEGFFRAEPTCFHVEDNLSATLLVIRRRRVIVLLFFGDSVKSIKSISVGNSLVELLLTVVKLVKIF